MVAGVVAAAGVVFMVFMAVVTGLFAGFPLLAAVSWPDWAKLPEVVIKRAANKANVFLISGSYYVLVLSFDDYNTKIGTLYCIEHCFMLGGRFY
jgi:hypothetical protein